MKLFPKILYYLRLFLFLTVLVLIFINIKNYIKVGLWGYIFLTMEFIYITLILFTILSKRKIYQEDLVFNIMHIGSYMYQLILSFKMFSFKLSTLVLNSYKFYRNNYIILSILLFVLIIYTIALYDDYNNKELNKKC